ncbi:MAG: aldehyde dehydrogenase family protein [Sphingobacteriales bacterium]|nr:aldehyde dehydrogenase family protein [Sphingobacteriales bacterium]
MPRSFPRLEILKTYKIYIGGQLPRTESGRYYVATNSKGEPLANICLSSRKDFRDAVVSARSALAAWSGRSAFNRGQIVYRIAEMLEGRKTQFIEELIKQGATKAAAEKEITLSIDRLVYYSGWCDKYQQIFSTVNPVASSHFNFSVSEPTGVVAVMADQQSALIGLVSLIAPIIAGGNTCVVLASSPKPLCAVTFAEVLNSSDLPGGVVNILTGNPTELLPFFADHMDVNAVAMCSNEDADKKMVPEKAANNMKRVRFYDRTDWLKSEGQSPYFISDFQEVKTTWHPIENIGGGRGGY